MDVIIFDVDGVLGDFTKLKHLRDIAHIQNVALKHNIDFEAAKELFFSTKKKLKEQDKHSTIDTMMELGFSREEYYESINSVPVEGNIVLTEHAVEVLEKLSKKYNIVALTNTPHDSNKKVLVYLYNFFCFNNI